MDSSLITILTSLVISFVTYIAVTMKKTYKQRETYIVAIGNGMKVLLADRIHQAHKYNIHNGYCCYNDLSYVENLYKEYCNLGGNGTITKLMEDIRALPTHDKGG